MYNAMKIISHERVYSVRDTVKNVGRVVSGVTRLEGEAMDGDEDVQQSKDESKHFCDRFDSWFDSLFFAHESGSSREKKKAGIYTTNDHDELEQTVLKSGPNRFAESKLVQLGRLTRLHREYRNGNLESCLLSNYLVVSHKLRKDVVAVLRGRAVKDLDGVVLYGEPYEKRLKELRLPLRLGKFPKGWAILADRGFANDATQYLNMNVQMTPSFLSGRDQFTFAELSADMVKCKLRYNSETNWPE